MVDVPVLFCFDSRVLLGAGVSIMSLIEAADNGTRYDIRIFHPGFCQSVCDAFQKLVSGTRHSIRFHAVDLGRFAGMVKGKGSWTEIVYFRLLASEILHDLDKVIYSDVDVFFKSDMAEVFSIDLEDYSWAGVAAEANRPDNIMHRYFPENKKDVIYFSGFMVMNLHRMRKEQAVDLYFDTIRTFGSRLKFFDLDVLNIATEAIAPLPFNFVVLEDVYEADSVSNSADFSYLKSVYSVGDLEKARKNPAIIHFAGRRGKPWQRRCVPFYYQNLIDKLPPLLRRPTVRDLRRRWFTKKGRQKLNFRAE